MVCEESTHRTARLGCRSSVDHGLDRRPLHAKRKVGDSHEVSRWEVGVQVRLHIRIKQSIRTCDPLGMHMIYLS